jgi:sensor histidine kinase YesM
MKRYFIHSALFRILAPAVYGVLVYLLILLLNNNVAQIRDLFIGQEVYVCIVLSYLSFEVSRIAIVLSGRMLKHRSESVRMAVQLLATVVLSVAAVLTSLSLYFTYMIGFTISGTQLMIFGGTFAVTALIYNVLYLSNYYLQKENTLKLTSEKQQRDVLEMEMLEFRNDINPDLLYESLESLIALMYRDVEQAEDYIDCLASAYRYVLTNRQQELVTVATELDAARILVRLLNERYNNLLKFESALEPDELEAVLIPGSLPVIIESMVRNTIVSRFEPFVIRCYREDDYITLQCRLNDKLLLHPSSEMALSRLQKSYSLYSDLPLIKVKAYQENYVKLPLIQMEEAIALP